MNNSVQRYFFAFIILLGTVFLASNVFAIPKYTPMYDHSNGWHVDLGGFVELDNIYDNTRTYTEVPNNSPVTQGLSVATAAQGGSINGDTPRFQQSARNSRLRVFAVAPDQDGWTAHGYFEMDFLGFEPTVPGLAPSGETEQAAYTSGTFRMRLAQVTFTKNDWIFSVGQEWDLFGWQPYYELSNLQNTGTINLVERTPQLMVGRDLHFGDDLMLETAVSVNKGDQRDAAIPNLNAGVNLNWYGRRAAHLANSHTHSNWAPTSLAISGKMNQFSTPNTDGNDADRTGYVGGSVAVQTIIPILTTDEKDSHGSLNLLGEFARGQGLSNQYTGFNGGFGTASSAYTTGAAGSVTQFDPNLDAGMGAWDNTGTFQLIQTQSWTAQLQWFVPWIENETVINVEYGHLETTNAYNLFNTYVAASQTTAAQATYDYNEYYAVNASYSLTKDIRIAGEYDRFLTHYIQTGNYPVDNRLQFSAFYIF